MSIKDIRYYPSHLPPHNGERYTVNYLKRHLPEGILLVNYYIGQGYASPTMLEVDVVVINGNGVYLIEVKHWRKMIEAYQDKWFYDGRERNNPVFGLQGKVNAMQSLLVRKGQRNVSTAGLVVLSNGRDKLQEMDSGDWTRKLFGLDEALIQALTGDEFVHKTPVAPRRRSRYPASSHAQKSRQLRPQDIDYIADLLFKSHNKEAKWQKFGYEAAARAQEHDYYNEITADHRHIPGRKVRIKQYCLPEVISDQELDKAVAHFKRDVMALVEAGEHPNLVSLLDFRSDPNTDDCYYLILEFTGKKTLAEKLTQQSLTLSQLPPLKGVA